MWGKIIIPMYRLWLNGLYGLYGPRCPLFSKRPINLISLSLSEVLADDKSALVQVMARCHSATSHYLKQWWLVIIDSGYVACLVPSYYLNQCQLFVNWTFSYTHHWNLYQIATIFLQENAIEIVICKVSSILCGPQCAIIIAYNFSTFSEG